MSIIEDVEALRRGLADLATQVAAGDAKAQADIDRMVDIGVRLEDSMKALEARVAAQERVLSALTNNVGELMRCVPLEANPAGGLLAPRAPAAAEGDPPRTLTLEMPPRTASTAERLAHSRKVLDQVFAHLLC